MIEEPKSELTLIQTQHDAVQHNSKWLILVIWSAYQGVYQINI